jgi:small subunit ribosomal protein S1
MALKSTGSQGAKPSFSMDDFAKALEKDSFAYEKGQVVRGKPFEYESNGAYVDIGGKSPGFIPIEEVALGEVSNLSEVLPLQEEREFLIITEPNADGQVTLSLRKLMLKKVWDELTEKFDNGEVLQVRVTGVNKGGVTVDVQGMRGFIPRSHLLERDNLESLIGQAVTTSFIEVNQERGKIILSQRMASQSSVFSQLEIGQLVEGKVTNFKHFGVFVDLDGITGLLHIKQVSQNYIDDLSKLFVLGQMIKAIVINLEEGRSRVSLSTRVLENYPGEMVEKTVEVMATADARAERAKKTVLQDQGAGV